MNQHMSKMILKTQEEERQSPFLQTVLTAKKDLVCSSCRFEDENPHDVGADLGNKMIPGNTSVDRTCDINKVASVLRTALRSTGCKQTSAQRTKRVRFADEQAKNEESFAAEDLFPEGETSMALDDLDGSGTRLAQHRRGGEVFSSSLLHFSSSSFRFNDSSSSQMLSGPKWTLPENETKTGQETPV
eukprot:CAMPEP_0116841462 /NCGR_PEP_ID=MMETSP0418-20121206/10936_1 /TAXON_ID=1158023 /ORGANISM="Astrosyne radiata, Strain 13vi08-1A" /LENGTH=186 /DNA_ID=CAMNT_0004471887 /DNA_START=82 /DNA_END=642 /DNA_ORIENTATION=-